MSDMNDYAYRFQYADGSAFQVYADGTAFIVYKDGRMEAKFGKIDNRIPLLIGQAAKPRQDEIERLRAALEEIADALAPRPFYGAECPNYPSCNGGCGLGCTKEVEESRADVGKARE